jgi:fructosamine-3-kinase
VAGGDLNDAYRAELADGRVAFIKASSGSDFTAEAAGLSWLGEAPGGPCVPDVLAVGEGFLALSWIERGRLNEEELGRRLAALHRAGAPAPGALPPGAGDRLRIGPLALPISPAPGWPEVYGGLLESLAGQAGISVDALTERLPDLAGPPEPPARLHGDLWAGNVLADCAGVPYVIDPAAYGGHREVDLAMLRLFGGPGPRCFAAYEEVHPLADGHQDRVALYQLLPLLVHAVLFGGGYRARVTEVIRRYTG